MSSSKLDLTGEAKGRPVRIHGTVNNQFSIDGVWLKGNLHCHLAGIDPGYENWQRQALASYREMGYDFIAGMDHDQVVPVDTDEPTPLIVPGAEVFPSDHFLALGISELRLPEYRTTGRLDRVAAAVGEINRQGGITVLAHPLNTNWTIEELAVLCKAGLQGFEVYNSSSWNKGDTGRADQIWHMLNAAGHHLAAIGSDDAHGPQDLYHENDHPPRTPLGWTGVLARDRSSAAVLDAVRHRRTYASEGPEIHSVTLSPDGRLTVKCSPAAACHFRSEGGIFGGKTILPSAHRKVDTEFCLDLAAHGYRVKQAVVIIVEDIAGHKAWLSPLKMNIEMTSRQPD